LTVPYLTHTDRNRVCAHRPTNTQQCTTRYPKLRGTSALSSGNNKLSMSVLALGIRSLFSA
jgi:hypothetical protein